MEQDRKNDLIKRLMADVESSMGRKFASPTDFQQLANSLPKDTPLSISTLKRLWQYVPSKHEPRESTLTILSKVVGYNDWHHYCMAQRETTESDFLTAIDCLHDIPTGSILTLQWHPDRQCTLCMGEDGRFCVIAAVNTKLQPGDTFFAAWLEQGQPLMATQFVRNGQPQPDYVAGKRHGLTSITINNIHD